MREIDGHRLKDLTVDHQEHIHVHPLFNFNELEKKNPPAAAQTNSCANDLEELQQLLHFPEEVALRLADTEYQLFYQAPPNEYLRQVTLDLGESVPSASEAKTSSSTTTVSTLIKRFNEVSAWVTQLIISQGTHEARRAVLSCVLRVALSCWNIGNFNGAMEIIAGLKSNKLKPFWLSITEKESLPVLDFLSAALLSAEYDRALNRALQMPECPVVPFFGVFLRELKDIMGADKEQQMSAGKQVFSIADYPTWISRAGTGKDKMYRAQAVLDHIRLCHEHFKARSELTGNSSNWLEYLKRSCADSRTVTCGPTAPKEYDEEYEFDVEDYQPVQPLIHDHSVSFVNATKIDQHILQIMHHGSTVVLWEGQDGGGVSTPPMARATHQFLRLDRAGTTLTWVRPNWTNESDVNLSFNPEETLPPGLLTRLALQTNEPVTTGSTLEDGYLDLMYVKEIKLGARDQDELSTMARKYGLIQHRECSLTIVYGQEISENRLLYIVLPPILCRVWFVGLTTLLRSVHRQMSLTDRRLWWLREQYLILYHEDGYCCGPLAADAIRTFGGRDWALAGTSATTTEPIVTAGTLRRDVSMKLKKKQLLNNPALKEKNLKFMEPPTMCMESGYWRQTTQQHRQSTPATFPEVARHMSIGQLPYTAASSSHPRYDRDRHHGSTADLMLWQGRHPRVGSVLYDTQLDFVDFVALFRSFSLLIRKDIRDLFEQLAISYRGAVPAQRPLNLNNGLPQQTTTKSTRIGLLTRNSNTENPQKKIFDAIAASSIFTNCAGIDTNNSQVITQSTFTKFLETRQMEQWTVDQIQELINRHEPDPGLRAQNCLSFEGFARYLMDKENFAFLNELQVPDDAEMSRPMSTYYVATSHNTYLTGHQLKGESSVELYGQVLLSGCRCVELDCWDGDDGYPMIYHGHTFTTKIPFNSVVETIERNAFVTSPYPVILSIENHCSLQQQTRMAHVFQKVFGDKLVKSFLFDSDFGDEPSLPSPNQLRHRILIKNKKLIMEVPVPNRPGGGGVALRHTVPTRTSSIISNTSSSSFNDDFSDEDYDEDDDDENLDEKTLHGLLTGEPSTTARMFPKNMPLKRTQPPPLPPPSDEKLKKQRSSQISKELSDLVVYVQAIKFRGLNTVSPTSAVRHRQRSASEQSAENTDVVSNAYLPCYQCSSINENTAKKLCRKQALALVTHTQTQLMRTYPAGMRIDSSNFNPVIFWSFGIQMAALNYQTDDLALHLNTAIFEQNGCCGYVTKPSVMWDRTHVMYKRFNPWDKEFDGLHSCQCVLNIVSGQYIHPSMNLSTFVEVEVIGIPVDCAKQKTRTVQKNCLNPIWNDTFQFRVLFQDLTFLRFSVIDASGNHTLAQRILPLKCLRPGYRHLRLRTAQNHVLPMATLFIYSRVEEESLENATPKTQENRAGSVEMPDTVGGTPLCVKRRMFFLMVYGVVPEEPYTILKITQESSTRDVLLLCGQKAAAGIPADKQLMNDYILVEEVARGWEKKDHNLPATQRILDLEERPLQAQSQWRGEGRFLLKRVGDDPSSRAWLSSIRSVANRERDLSKRSDSTTSTVWEENDTFLVCIYNVSPEIPYCILKVPLDACAQDVLAQALVKARRLEDPLNFVLVEELEWAGGTGHSVQQRALADMENVYSAQSHWQTIGRFVLQERSQATPSALRKHHHRIFTASLRLATLDRISRGLKKAPAQTAYSDPTPTTTTSRWRRGVAGAVKGNSEKDTNATASPRRRRDHREVHSEGETLSDDGKDTDLLTTVSRLKRMSLKKIKEWTS